jgi:multidrug efflux pump subunit AcrA (membrane-fusion protein)
MPAGLKYTMRWNAWILPAAVSLAVGCSSAPDDAAIEPVSAMAVRASTVVMTELPETFEAGGVVEARATATVASRLVASVADVRVAPGDRVRAGQELVVLDGRDLEAHARAARAATTAATESVAATEAEERAAQAALGLARATFDRVTALHAKRSATAQELDQATAALRSAEHQAQAMAARVKEAAASAERASASRDAAMATEAFLRVTAPFDGLVVEKLIEPGNMVSPGQPLLRVEDTRSFLVAVRMDESRGALVTVGQPVDVVLGAGTGPIVSGSVSEVSRAVRTDDRTALVKVALPTAAGLRSGAFARVRFTRSQVRKALTVPAEAIVANGQMTSVFVVDADVARLRLVRLREREVLAGLTEGERVVVSPPPGLSDGRSVVVEGGP